MVTKGGDEYETIRELKLYDLFSVLTSRLTYPTNEKGEKHCPEREKG